MRRALALIGLLPLLAAAACGDDNDHGNDPGAERPPESLNILRLAADAPPLESTTLSFWAVRGESREGKLYFQDGAGQRGDEYLGLKFDSNTLSALPDGTPIPVGDSVLVTITVVDPARILFQFAPEGLRFSTSEPAELRIRYAEADKDYDDDGDEDDRDDDIELQLGVWRQAEVGQPFVRLGSALVEDLDEIDVDLTGFSRYAIAY